MAEHRLALLDTGCVIDVPRGLADIADEVVVSALSVAELASGLAHPDPAEAAVREERYLLVLREFEPVPFGSSAAHFYGVIARAVRRAGRSPRPRVIDLLLAATAADVGAVIVTRNPRDFAGLDDLVTVIAV